MADHFKKSYIKLELYISVNSFIFQTVISVRLSSATKSLAWRPHPRVLHSIIGRSTSPFVRVRSCSVCSTYRYLDCVKISPCDFSSSLRQFPDKVSLIILFATVSRATIAVYTFRKSVHRTEKIEAES